MVGVLVQELVRVQVFGLVQHVLLVCISFFVDIK